MMASIKQLFFLFIMIVFNWGYSPIEVNARLIIVVYGPESPIQTQADARSFAIAEALLRESEEYFVQRVLEGRRTSIRHYLSMVSQGLISNVAEIDEVIFNDGKIRSTFDISIRKDTLYTLLRELGTVYTLYSLQPYTLEKYFDETTVSVDISLLESVSGVTQCTDPTMKNDYPKLYLTKEGDTWTGILTPVEGEPIQVDALSLDMVWRGVWSKFFSQLNTQQTIGSEEYILTVWGWKNGAGVEELGQAMEHWVYCAKDVLLHEVNINKSIIAQWTISITNKAVFEEQMTQYTLTRNLEYELSHKK